MRVWCGYSGVILTANCGIPRSAPEGSAGRSYMVSAERVVLPHLLPVLPGQLDRAKLSLAEQSARVEWYEGVV